MTTDEEIVRKVQKQFIKDNPIETDLTDVTLGADLAIPLVREDERKKILGNAWIWNNMTATVGQDIVCKSCDRFANEDGNCGCGKNDWKNKGREDERKKFTEDIQPYFDTDNVGELKMEIQRLSSVARTWRLEREKARADERAKILQKIDAPIDMGACGCPEYKLIKSHIELDRDKLKKSIEAME